MPQGSEQKKDQKLAQLVPSPDLALAVRSMLAPIAEAEIKKSEHGLEAHKATLSTMDKSDSRSHTRLMLGLIVGSILILGICGLAAYAYVHGDKEFASKVAIGVGAFLTGTVGGWGAKAEAATQKMRLNIDSDS